VIAAGGACARPGAVGLWIGRLLTRRPASRVSVITSFPPFWP